MNSVNKLFFLEHAFWFLFFGFCFSFFIIEYFVVYDCCLIFVVYLFMYLYFTQKGGAMFYCYNKIFKIFPYVSMQIPRVGAML